MKNFFIILVLAFVTSSCLTRIKGNGSVTRETREVRDFRELDISSAFKVHIRQGEAPSLIIEADENLLPHIIDESNGDELKIYADAFFSKYKKLHLYITVKSLEDIELSGACSARGEGIFRSAKLDIDASGASELEMEVEVGELELDVSGASDITLKGRVENMRLDASGASEIDVLELKAIRGSVELSGASQADVYVTDELKIEASGASEIRYKGTPAELKQRASGASEIRSYSN